MPNWSIFSLIIAGPLLSSAAESRPRGVAPEFAKFFKSKDSFSCIYNPSIQIPTSKINDDFCDCPDGSDEPGTSACSYLSSLSPSYPLDVQIANANISQALPGFYCKNKGHQPSYLPFHHVNDGVCDYELCCDGSDEYDKVGGISCPDKCKEIGKEWKKHDEARQKAMGSALKRRKELVAEAQRRQKEVEERLVSLGTEITGQEMKVKALEAELAEAEKKDRGRVVKGATKGKAGVLAGLAKESIEELRTALNVVRAERDASITRVKELEGILSKFKTEYNPNFNDEGVKMAVRSWEEYAAVDRSGQAEDADFEKDLDDLVNTETESINWKEFETAEEDGLDLLYSFEAYLPPSFRTWFDAKLRELRVFMIENGVIAGGDASASESPAVTSARSELNAAQSKLRDLTSDRDSHAADVNKDYGPDGVFRSLKGQCVSKDSGEYTYEMCWLEKTKQKPKKGGAETNMGNYVGLGTLVVDDEIPADGRGVGKGERITMKFENGQGCWNGPSRSTTVVLACAENDEIWKVTEEEKCVYRMDVGTAAVCEPAKKKTEVKGGKDEL